MTSRNWFFPIGRLLLEYGRGWMVCITIRFSFMVISSNQLYLAIFFSLTKIEQKFPFLRTALRPWRRRCVSMLWHLEPFIVSFGFYTFIMISVFLGSRKYPCYFCDFFLSLEFCFIGYYCYSCDICKWLSHKMFGELFSLPKLLREFANKIVPGHLYRIFFFFYSSLCTTTPYHTNRQTRPRGKLNITTIWYWLIPAS